MAIRITGMNSGLDTESIISELVKAKSTKKDNLVKAQTKLQWKQDAWKELNSKVYALYSKTLSNMRLKSDYTKKTTKVSNSNAATVITGATAVNGVQTLKVNQLAKTGYLTGGKLEEVNGEKVTSKTKLTEMGISEGSEIQLTVGDTNNTISVSADMTVGDFVSKLRNAGLNASFDEKNQRFFISAKEAGTAADFSLTAVNDTGTDALKKLCLETSTEDDYKKRQEALKYCNEHIDNQGNVTYTAKTADELKDIIEKNVQDRLLAYNNKQKELVKTQEDIDAKKKEIEDKQKEIEDLGDTDSDAKKELETELAALNKEMTALTDTKSTLEAEIDAEKDYYVQSADGNYQLDGDKLKTQLTIDAVNTANEAAEALNSPDSSTGATRISGQDAVITLNGAVFTSDTNNFEINGLTITATAETEEEFTITTADDTDGIYDMIKGFLKEYNELINEMDKLYNADSSKGYEPLTDEEKEAMSEKDIEKWEEKIKDSLLRRDSTLNTVASAMKQIMMQGVEMGDGSKMYLSEFGIETLGYFTAKDNEKNAYHIDGDPDDSSTMANADKLKTAIANDPDKVVEFFSSLSKNLYEKLGDLMKKTEYSSSFTLYDDVAMREEYNDYTSKIKAQEQKITDFEDRYYKKFSAMETALAKLSSKESAISGLLGM